MRGRLSSSAAVSHPNDDEHHVVRIGRTKKCADLPGFDEQAFAERGTPRDPSWDDTARWGGRDLRAALGVASGIERAQREMPMVRSSGGQRGAVRPIQLPGVQQADCGAEAGAGEGGVGRKSLASECGQSASDCDLVSAEPGAQDGVCAALPTASRSAKTCGDIG